LVLLALVMLRWRAGSTPFMTTGLRRTVIVHAGAKDDLTVAVDVLAPDPGTVGPCAWEQLVGLLDADLAGNVQVAPREQLEEGVEGGGLGVGHGEAEGPFGVVVVLEEVAHGRSGSRASLGAA